MTDLRGAPLAAAELPALLARVHAALDARRERLDALNVFPVPDGDTGTNMALTVLAGLQALEDAQPRSGAEASRQVTRGVLRGARGNSGVILSQVLRAVVEEVTGHREVDAPLFAAALRRARDLAYEAVADPVEGTILTAVRVAAQTATTAADSGADLVTVSARTCAAVAAAVEATPQQLPVLREAGVVDAGARGFEVLLAAVHGHLTGEEPAVRLDAAPAEPRTAAGGCALDLAQPFEVQYLLDADDAAAPRLRRELEQIGGSVVVVAAGGLLNVHVHTADAGLAIEAGLVHGHASRIEVVHLGDQVAARAAGSGPVTPVAAPGDVAASAAARSVGGAGTGCVAVVHGDGLLALAGSLGAGVVPGTSGALPSVAQLLEAVAARTEPDVLVLPGHRNVVPGARQAADLAAADGRHRVHVVEAAINPPAVLAALAVLDVTAPVDVVLPEVTAAASAVHAGSVVAAVRDADTPVGPVRAGTSLALVRSEVVAACDDPLVALAHVCDGLDLGGAEVVTLLLGADVDAAQRTAARAVVAARTDAELEVIEAGQRPAPFWVGVG